MLRVKKGVRLHGAEPELLFAVVVAERLWAELGFGDLVVTSVIDGEHIRGSLHYTGNAADLRLPRGSKVTAARELRKALGADYDVVLERDHIHVEFQPKIPY